MPLSLEQLRYIRRHGPQKSPEAIAQELKISLKRVRRALGGAQRGKPERKRPTPTVFNLGEWMSWIIAATCMIAPFLVFTGVRDFENLPKLVFIQSSALLLAFLALKSKPGSRLHPDPPKRTLILIVSLIGITMWAFLSLFWAPDIFSAQSMWMHGTACALFFFLAYGHYSRPRHVERLLDGIVCAALLISLLGIAQYLMNLDWVKQQIAPAATFNNRNMAAHFIVLALPAAVAMYLSGRNPVRVWVSSLTIALLLSFLFYTLTRAAWLGSLSVLALVAALLFRHIAIARRGLPKWSRQVHRLAAGSIALIVLGVLLHSRPTGMYWPEQAIWRMVRGLPPASERTPSFEKRNSQWEAYWKERKARRAIFKIGSKGTIRVRRRLWGNALEILKTRPLRGAGLSNFHVYYPAATTTGHPDPELRLNRSADQAHNDFIQIITELGVPALIFIFPALVVLLGSGIRLVFFGNHPLKERITALALLAGIVGILVNALFSFPFYRALPPLYFAVYSGVLMAMADGRFATQRGKAVGNRAAGGKILGPLLAEPRFRTGLWITWGLAAAIWIAVQGRHVAADHFFKREMIALTQEKNFKEVVIWGSKAVSWNPWQMEAKQFLGRAFMRTGNLEKAEQLLSDVHRALPHSTSLLFDLGECYRELKEYQQAQEHFLHALKILPRNGELNGALGRVHLAQGNMEDAFRYFEKAIEAMPENGFYLFQLGHAAQAIGRSQRAQEAFRQSLKFSGAWIPFTHKELGMLLIGSDSAKRQREGLKHLKRAMAMKPKIVNAERLKEFAAQIAAVDAGN